MLLLSVVLLILPLQKLVNMYMYILSAILFTTAYYASFRFVKDATDHPQENPTGASSGRWTQSSCLQLHLAAQCIVASVVSYLINIRGWARIPLMVFATPMLAFVAGYPTTQLHLMLRFASAFALAMTVFFVVGRVSEIKETIYEGLRYLDILTRVARIGWIPVILMVVLKIALPLLLLCFWVVLFGLQLYRYFSVEQGEEQLWLVVLASVGECCLTPISILGLCVTVSYFSHAVLVLARLYLQGPSALTEDNQTQNGWTEGCTMFLLAIQTGLSELKRIERVFILGIVFFIVLSSLIQSVFEITDPFLLGLCASQNKNVWKHLRTLALCMFLWMFPAYMTYSLCYYFELEFWLMVVVSSCVLTSLQVLGSLMVYALFMYDSFIASTWESMDDVVYYTKATVRVLEFIVAVFVVVYGIQESIFGDWSWVSVAILVIHCYFNVWQRLQTGWRTYLQRREAVKKTANLPLASPQQLQQHNDLCPICFQDMETACITPCQHYFHVVCLRKWFYVQNTCPLCHRDMSQPTEEEEEEAQEET